MAAARAWANGDLSPRRPSAARAAADAETLADAKAFGASEAQLAVMESEMARQPANDGAAAFTGVWPDNAPAVTAFCTVARQWRAGPAFARAPWLGLDYAACEAGWRFAGIIIDRETFFGFQVVEAEAAAALNDQWAKGSAQ